MATATGDIAISDLVSLTDIDWATHYLIVEGPNGTKRITVANLMSEVMGGETKVITLDTE